MKLPDWQETGSDTIQGGNWRMVLLTDKAVLRTEYFTILLNSEARDPYGIVIGTTSGL